jgi:Tol biopolymer transport system component
MLGRGRKHCWLLDEELRTPVANNTLSTKQGILHVLKGTTTGLFGDLCAELVGELRDIPQLTRTVAYVSDESGKNQVYVRQFPGLGEKVPVSIEEGQNPRWSHDGRELFYLDPAKNQVMAVDVRHPSFYVNGRSGSSAGLPSHSGRSLRQC